MNAPKYCFVKCGLINKVQPKCVVAVVVLIFGNFLFDMWSVVSSSKGCFDIDECIGQPCSNEKICKNKEASFDCICGTGYLHNSTTQQCEDVDECATNAPNCERVETCGNTVGSYTCTCIDGYHLSLGSCFDIDECATGLVCN